MENCLGRNKSIRSLLDYAKASARRAGSVHSAIDFWNSVTNKFSDKDFSRPAWRFLPFASLKQKHRSGLLVPTHATQVYHGTRSQVSNMIFVSLIHVWLATPPRRQSSRWSDRRPAPAFSSHPGQKTKCPNAIASRHNVLVPRMGLEPISLTAEDFKSSVYTIPPPGHVPSFV